MANPRTHYARSASCNGATPGGLTVWTVNEGHGRKYSGVLDGAQGGEHALARGDKFVNGSMTCEDCDHMVTILTSTPSPTTTFLYTKESGLPTWKKILLANPVFGNLRFTSAIGAKSQFTLDYECRFQDGDDFSDVVVPLSSIAEISVPAVVVPTSWSELIGFTCGAVTIGNLQGFNFNVAGTWLQDSNPGTVGREAVEWTPDSITFSLTFRDHTYAGATDKAQSLFALAATDLVLDYEVIGAADKVLTLANAVWDENVIQINGRGWTGFTVTGRCDFVGGGNLHTLTDATHKLITIA